MKRILSIIGIGIGLCFLFGCQSEEAQLLKPRVYFEQHTSIVTLDGSNEINCDLSARVSSKTNKSQTITYSLGSNDLVAAYNKRNGTDYVAFDMSNVNIDNPNTTISSYGIAAEVRKMRISNLNLVESGKTYLIPVEIKNSSLPVISGSNVIYYILKKPVRIMTAWKLNSNSVKVPFPSTMPFKSITYEALVNVSYFGSNNTVMGHEGRLIFRIGDVGGGLPKDNLQIAGSIQFNDPVPLTPNKWYHLAFTYDANNQKATIYVNGEKVAEKLGAALNIPNLDYFFLGKVDGFKWGERPLHGYMSEVRVWNVARTQNEINQSMLKVDPKSEGLVVYYKLDGTDQYEREGKYYIKNGTGDSNYDGISNNGRGQLVFANLSEPIKVK